MNFRVDTAALRRARARFVDLSDDTTSAETYAATYLDITGADNGLMFVHIDNVNNDVRARLTGAIGRLRSLLADSGLELGAAARYYDVTDQAAAERADADIPPVPRILPGDGYDDRDPLEDTVPEDPGDYEPPEGHQPPPQPDDDEMIMAPGPIGEPPSTGTTGVSA